MLLCSLFFFVFFFARRFVHFCFTKEAQIEINRQEKEQKLFFLEHSFFLVAFSPFSLSHHFLAHQRNSCKRDPHDRVMDDDRSGKRIRKDNEASEYPRPGVYNSKLQSPYFPFRVSIFLLYILRRKTDLPFKKKTQSGISL